MPPFLPRRRRRRREGAPAPLPPDAPVMRRNRRCVSTYTAELGRHICERIAAGETREAICAHPDMPSRSTLRHWTRMHREFAEAYAAARAQASAGAIAFNLALAEQRRESRARRDGGRRSTFTEARGREVCRRLIGGETPAMIGADPAMPSGSTIYYWLRARPDFQAMYAEARELMAEAKLHQAWDVAVAATPETLGQARLKFAVLRWQVALMAPTKYRREALEAAAERPALNVVIRRFVLPGEEYGPEAPLALERPEGD